MPITSKPSEFYGHRFFTRKIIATFLDFFSKKIYVERYDHNGDVYKYIRPPVHFANRERFFNVFKSANLATHNTTNQLDLGMVLPRMSVNISGLAYDGSRKVTKTNQILAENFDSDQQSIDRVLTPVPYNLDLELNVVTKSVDDTFQIIEQIVPFFTPHLSFNVNLLDGFKAESIPFTLNNTNPDMNDEWGITDDKLYISTFGFVAKMNYYYIKRNTRIMKHILANIHVGEDDSYKKIQSYELDANSFSPVKVVLERPEEYDEQTIEYGTNLVTPFAELINISVQEPLIKIYT